MSDTDDTDVLLLSRPDLFLVQSFESDNSFDENTSKATESTVVSNLLKQVYSLENQIQSKGTKESVSIDGNFSSDIFRTQDETLPTTSQLKSPNISLGNSYSFLNSIEKPL